MAGDGGPRDEPDFGVRGVAALADDTPEPPDSVDDEGDRDTLTGMPAVSLAGEAPRSSRRRAVAVTETMPPNLGPAVAFERSEHRPVGTAIPGQVACSACGKRLDPLRAGHVAIFNAQLHVFCDFARCRASFLGQPVVVKPPPAPEVDPARRAELEAVLPPVRAVTASVPDADVPERLEVDDEDELVEPIDPPVAVGEPIDPAAEPERREMGLLLVALALVAGLLTMALELAANRRLLAIARLVLVGVGAAALLGRALTSPRDPAQPHWLVMVAGPVLAGLLAGWAFLSRDLALSARAAFLAGTVLTTAALDVWVVGVAGAPLVAARRWLEGYLAVLCRRIVGPNPAPGQKELVAAVVPGELVAVEVGETVPVDVELLDCEVEVLPWAGATSPVRRRAGDPVVAGATVVSGSLRGKVTWVGDDRALARPILNPQRRADAHAALPQTMRQLSERWAPAIAMGAGVVAWLVGQQRGAEVAMVVVAVYAAFANVALGSLVGLAVARGMRLAMSRGVVFNDAAAFDRASRVTAAVFCARGTLLRGEPELVEVEVSSRRDGVDADEVLRLAAGVLAQEVNPVAVAIRRAARERGLRSDAARNVRRYEGRGVTAVASSAESLCVGSRSFLLERRVSVAVAEDSIVELEGAGRTVVLVARGGRLIGLLALQDGLRSGARAAVQHLLDTRVEPILMSADTRETCEALGRALDIDHLRPEVADEERGEAVRRIGETGASVAVLGHTPFDDLALDAADASVALSAAGGERDDFAVTLVSDDVRDASLALALAQRTRQQAGLVAGVVLGPAVLGSFIAAVGILPPEYAPLAQTVGAFAALGQLRSLDPR